MLNRLVFMYNVCERVIWPGLVAVGLWEVCLSSVIIRYNPDKRRPQERTTTQLWTTSFRSDSLEAIKYSIVRQFYSTTHAYAKTLWPLVIHTMAQPEA
jgi:hypothetical protein